MKSFDFFSSSPILLLIVQRPTYNIFTFITLNHDIYQRINQDKTKKNKAINHKTVNINLAGINQWFFAAAVVCSLPLGLVFAVVVHLVAENHSALLGGAVSWHIHFPAVSKLDWLWRIFVWKFCGFSREEFF